MTGPLDIAGQKLMDAGNLVAGATTYLALLNAEMDKAHALITEVSPNGFAELHSGLEQVKVSSHLLMQFTQQVSQVIFDKGVEIINRPA
jgi:hypothetical protein